MRDLGGFSSPSDNLVITIRQIGELRSLLHDSGQSDANQRFEFSQALGVLGRAEIALSDHVKGS